MDFARAGAPHRPGDELFRTRYEVRHPRVDPRPERVADYRRNPAFFREQWWDDGTVLAGGREFTALSASRCYTRGELSCVTCHTMHGGDPDDQLKPAGAGSAACVRCHSEPRYATTPELHTRHARGSTGSDCMNCHMPHTTYALFKAIRSHQIESPRSDLISRYGTPNACNLCHLDRTLAWTREQLFVGWGQRRYPLSSEQEATSAALLWMLKGDAAQRAIAAWHVGWPPARAVSGTNWLAPFQARLLDDPYGVVRQVAARALRTLPGYGDFAFDFLAPADALARRRDDALAVWLRSAVRPERSGDSVLIAPDGRPMDDRVGELLRRRDDRPVTIQE
jgi:predicted CXXCH cytochrome family protein